MVHESMRVFIYIYINLCITNNYTIICSRAIRLYPKGNLKANEKWLSLFLQLAPSETLAADEKVYVRAHLQVLDQRGSNHAKDTSMSSINTIYGAIAFAHFLFSTDVIKVS